uniref:WAP four-disulfide core domain protein 2 n=1 Tax=Monodelphis domestica TaxID=13616 RepID=F7G8P3_MONDO
MASKLTPFLAFLGGLFLLFFLGLPPAFGQNSTSEYLEKEGVCPELPERKDCRVECVSDMDCPYNQKCCSAGCSAFCIVPNEKKGTCPQIDSSISQLGVCHDLCQEDSECSGQLKCCLNGCRKLSCVTPIF